MNAKDYQTLRTRFLEAYANLPLQARKEWVAVIEEEPITWMVAFFEIRNETEKGKLILAFLERLGII